MININKNLNIKNQLEENHFVTPFKKSNGKWGVKGSSAVDGKTEKESLELLINYLLNIGQIQLN